MSYLCLDGGLAKELEKLVEGCLEGSKTMACGSSASIVEEVLKQCPRVRAVLLYGSAARGETTSRSDIDILVLAGERCSVELEPPPAAS